ncbi:MAG: preprotein translocase subunit SecE [Myxococcota bacterium]
MQSAAGIVAIAFIIAALLVSFVLGHTLHWTFLTLGIFDQPLLGDQFTVTTAIAAAIGFGAAFFTWRNPRINTLAQEVVAELRKVTWPTAAETRAATVVVIVTSVAVSLVLGAFDLGFNWVIERIF